MFGRGKTTAEEAPPAVAGHEARTDGKGRATPKRREAEKGRRRAAATPKTRKEAYRAMRATQREERGRQMASMRSGDERNLPPRDRGPVRRYARDLVDARRSVAEFFLPLALLILVLSFTPNPRLQAIGSTLWLALVVLVLMDSVLLGVRLRRGLAKNFAGQPTRGVLPYALMRSMQIRKFRLPSPRVKAGRRRG